MLKEILDDVYLNFRFSRSQLDSRGNKFEGWGIGQNKGNYKYDPPLGWIGIGLKVIGMYGDDAWIGNTYSKREWAVAYHGVGRGQSSEEIKRIIGIIIKGGFRQGYNQVHEDCPDINHPGKNVGKGVFFSSSIKTAEMYAGIIKINEQKYKTILMVRVKPNAIRKCNCLFNDELFVVNGTVDEVRPYRILFKPN